MVNSNTRVDNLNYTIAENRYLIKLHNKIAKTYKIELQKKIK